MADPQMDGAVRRAVDALREHSPLGNESPAAAALEAAYAASQPRPASPTAVTEGMALAAMREFSAQKGESHDAMWDQLEQRERDELIGEWIAILECAALSASAGDAPTRDLLRLARTMIANTCVADTSDTSVEVWNEWCTRVDAILYPRPTERQTPTETPK